MTISALIRDTKLRLKAAIACFGVVLKLLFGERNNPSLKVAKFVNTICFPLLFSVNAPFLRFVRLEAKGFVVTHL